MVTEADTEFDGVPVGVTLGYSYTPVGAERLPTVTEVPVAVDISFVRPT